MRTFFDLMNFSTEVNDKQQNFPDVLSTGWIDFETSLPLSEYYIEDQDIDHFDKLCYNIYGVPYYDDIILWFNHTYRHDLVPGQVIYFPNIVDINNYYNKNKK